MLAAIVTLLLILAHSSTIRFQQRSYTSQRNRVVDFRLPIGGEDWNVTFLTSMAHGQLVLGYDVDTPTLFVAMSKAVQDPSGGYDFHPHLYEIDARSGEVTRRVPTLPPSISGECSGGLMSAQPGGRYVMMSRGEEATFRQVDVRNGRVVRDWRLPTRTNAFVAIDPDHLDIIMGQEIQPGPATIQFSRVSALNSSHFVWQSRNFHCVSGFCQGVLGPKVGRKREMYFISDTATGGRAPTDNVVYALDLATGEARTAIAALGTFWATSQISFSSDQRMYYFVSVTPDQTGWAVYGVKANTDHVAWTTRLSLQPKPTSLFDCIAPVIGQIHGRESLFTVCVDRNAKTSTLYRLIMVTGRVIATMDLGSRDCGPWDGVLFVLPSSFVVVKCGGALGRPSFVVINTNQWEIAEVIEDPSWKSIPITPVADSSGHLYWCYDAFWTPMYTTHCVRRTIH